MRKTSRLIGLLAMGLLPSCAALAAAPPPVVSFWLVPAVPSFKSFADVSLWLEYEPSVLQTGPVDDMEYEVRDMARHTRVARMPYFEQIDQRIDDRHPIRGREYGVNDKFDREDLWQLAQASPGTYQVAMLVNGVRASNVVEFTIDPAFEAARQPTLRLGMLEAPPAYPNGLPLLWYVGPTPVEKDFNGLATEAPLLRADGVESREQIFAFDSRGERPVPAGNTGRELLHLERYQPGVDASRPHIYQTVIGNHTSAAVRLDLKAQPLAEAWDAATSSIADAFRPPPLLEGDIVDATGSPAAGMIVDLDVARTISDEQGHYSFTNLPAGEYSVSCRSPFRYPIWAMGIVPTLDPAKPQRVNISFLSRYFVSGSLTKHGRPLAGIKMNASWREAGGYASCTTQAVTDAEGHYECRGPYATLDSVGVNYDGSVDPWPPNKQDVKAGMRNVDFRL